jgi:hypothetical protein
VALSDEPEVLTVDFDHFQVAGTVRGHATVVVRVEDPAARPVLRLRRYLARLTVVRFRDLAPDGSTLGPDRDVETGADADARVLDHTVDPAPGAVAREYRLEWALDPRDHPSIGALGAEMLVIRVHLVTAGRDGAEQVREQQLITVAWTEPETVLRARGLGRSAPEPLRAAPRALLDDEDIALPRCGTCRRRLELDQLEREDVVWEHSATPRLEEVRRLLIERTAHSHQLHQSWPIPEHDRWHPDTADAAEVAAMAERLAAARERHLARLAAYPPSGTGGGAGGDSGGGTADGVASA